MAKRPDAQLRTSLAAALPIVDSGPCVIARENWTKGSSHLFGNFSVPCDRKKQRQSGRATPSHSGLARARRFHYCHRPAAARKKPHPDGSERNRHHARARCFWLHVDERFHHRRRRGDSPRRGTRSHAQIHCRKTKRPDWYRRFWYSALRRQSDDARSRLVAAESRSGAHRTG